MNQELQDWCDDQIKENCTMKEWEMYQMGISEGIRKTDRLNEDWRENLENKIVALKKALSKIEALELYDFERELSYMAEVRQICKFVKKL